MYWLQFYSDRVVQAFDALRDNGLRSVLSIIGIAVGIAAVMAVGAVSKGGSYLVLSELETFGLNSVWVFRDRNDKDPNRRIRTGTGLDIYDYYAIKDNCCSAMEKVTPVVFMRDQKRMIIQVGNHYSNARVIGANSDYLDINNDQIKHGRNFRPLDIQRRRDVAIIGPTVVKDLFGEGANPVGKDIRVGLKRFAVIGVLEEKSRDFLASIGSAGGQDANNNILIPFTIQQQINGNKEISFFQLKARSLEQSDILSEQVKDLLKRRNGKNYQYKTETMATYIGTADRIISGVAMIGVIAASISLLVGGLGIMNIMSTSVLERTREIGLRKAVGAGQSDILIQFLLEAIIISTLGGLLGLSLGAGASVVLAAVTDFPLTPTPIVIIIALIVSVIVGVASGFLPARRASRLHPVEALRYE